jgi:uncharacterized NAD(P)/FAD-binding protein YdhS
MKQIAIIGAGLSGTLLAMNLLQKKRQQPLMIRLIDRKPAENLGPAYSTDEDYLLNVPVEIMGAFTQDPAHFLKWIHKYNIDASEGDYMPRKLFRKYIHSMLEYAVRKQNDHHILERIQDEVMDIDQGPDGTLVIFKKNHEIPADIVILARGNSQPKNPVISNRSFFDEPRYIRNPWNADIFKNLEKQDDILFIGSGQTMIDLATGLHKKKHQGRLKAISRRGLLPLAQKKVKPYPSFFAELCNETETLSVFKIVRKHLQIAVERGYDIRSVIDALRPHTSELWMQLPAAEKQRFLRHVFRYWEIIRSRIPPESMRIINEMRATGQFDVLAGRITNFVSEKNKINMHYRMRGSQQEKNVTCNWVINCIGPNLDYDTIDEPLIQNLIRKKLIQSDPAHLGINALPDGSVIQEDGTTSNTLYTIGPTLKGVVWESIATPEIRVQAENLAEKIVSEL